MDSDAFGDLLSDFFSYGQTVLVVSGPKPYNSLSGDVGRDLLEIAIMELVASCCCLRFLSDCIEFMFALSMLTRGLAADANDRDLKALGGPVDLCTPEEMVSLALSTSIGVELVAAFCRWPGEGAFGKSAMFVSFSSSSTSASSSGASSGIFVCSGGS